MRNVICILVLLCTIYMSQQDILDPSRNLEALVNIEKKATEAVVIALSLFEKQTKENKEVKFNKLKAKALLEVSKVMNKAFDDVNLAIEKGREEHKKVDECYGYAKNTLEIENENTNSKLDTCIENGHTAMEMPLMNVAKTIETAQKLLTDLDAIIPNCYSPVHAKMEACVIKQLVVCRSSLKSIKQNVKEVINTTTVTYLKTISDIKSCTKKHITDIRAFSTDVIVHTNSCIRNAPTDNSKS